MFYVFLAEGFEETEALATLDVMRRAKLDVLTVGVTGEMVTSSHKVTVKADIMPDKINLDNIEGVVLPGGMPGTLNLEASKTVNTFIDYCVQNDKYVCAICAAPSILGHKGLLKGRKACCFPGFENELEGAKVSDDFVCTDGKYITAKGMGAAIEFSREITRVLLDDFTADRIKASLQCPF